MLFGGLQKAISRPSILPVVKEEIKRAAEKQQVEQKEELSPRK